ncbi:MAG: hypothetical protein R3F39_04875 [Myxococcota bacterium]
MALLLVGGAAWAADEAPARWVLEPSAERAVRGALRVDEPLADGQRLSAAIALDRIAVTVGESEAPTLHVTLVRAEDAPADAPRAAGVALLREPGPAPDELVATVLARLGEAPGPIAWAPPPPPAPTPQAASPDAAATAHARDRAGADALDAARHAMRVGDTAEAERRLRALTVEGTGAERLDVALLWRQLGRQADAEAALGDTTGWAPAEQACATLVREGADGAADPVAGATAETACAYTAVADTLHLMGRPDRAATVARALRTLDPACRLAWEFEIQALVAHRDSAGAVAVADKALERFPEDPDMAAAAAAAFQSAGELAKAVPLLERSGRARLGESGALRPLLGAMVRDVDNRAAYRTELERRVAAAPDDDVARFLLGVIRHYENDFAESQALLAPLETALDSEDRLSIYMAMNDFNLGRRDAALARLRRAATRPDPDPDVYYCMAEIERDTDRTKARDDLDRYAALSHGDALSNPGKEARIERLQALVRECIADGRPVCEGEWEHPRFRDHGDDRDWLWPAGFGAGALLLAAAGWAWRRRRRTNDGPSL